MQGGGRPIRVALGDQYPAFREAMRGLLATTPDLVLAGEAGSGEDVLRLAAELRPTVVVLANRLAGLNGLETTRRLRALAGGPPVVLLTAYPEGHDEAVAAGARTYLLKDSPRSALLGAIRQAAR